MDSSPELKLNQLDAFLEDTNSWLDNILSKLGWSEDSLEETKSSAAKTERKEIAKLPHRGDDKEEDVPLSSKFFYEQVKNVIAVQLDPNVCAQILGEEHKSEVEELLIEGRLTELDATLRLKLYEYCTAVARESHRQIRLADEQLMLLENKGQSEKPKTEIEIRAAMRDLKRRRQSYKGKNVHTASKSYTEVLRDVLVSQMEILSSQFAEEERSKEQAEREKKKDHRKESKKRTAEDSNNLESSSRKKHKKHHRKSHKSRHSSQERHVSDSQEIDSRSELREQQDTIEQFSETVCNCETGSIRNQLELKRCPVHDKNLL